MDSCDSTGRSSYCGENVRKRKTQLSVKLHQNCVIFSMPFAPQEFLYYTAGNEQLT